MPDQSASRMLQSFQTTAQPTSQQWLQDSSGPSPQSPPPQQATQATPITSTQLDDTVPTADDTQSQLNDQQKLATFEAILAEIDAEKQQVNTPEAAQDTAVIEEASVTAPPVQQYVSGGGIRKEQLAGTAFEVAVPELPGGMQYVESEPNPEIPAEVESFLQKVEENPVQFPQEIVIAAQQEVQATPRALPQDVKVLPITQEQEEAGKKKNTTFSIKWLVAFSKKLTEMFKGKAVYRME